MQITFSAHLVVARLTAAADYLKAHEAEVLEATLARPEVVRMPDHMPDPNTRYARVKKQIEWEAACARRFAVILRDAHTVSLERPAADTISLLSDPGVFYRATAWERFGVGSARFTE